MAGVPLKFRCYQCNGLLGVARSKAGAVVSCPKCGADLIVPEAAEPGSSSDGEEPAPGPSSIKPGSLDQGLALDFLDIRPEDIRVEPGIERLTISTAEAAPSLPREVPFLPEESSPDKRVLSEDAPAPGLPEEVPGPIIGRGADAAEPVLPQIRLEPPPIVHRRPIPTRSRDVLLPRSAVAAWSLFVLLAQGLAFVAGLLAGHFLWRVH